MLLSSWLKCSCKEEKKINYVCMYESHTKIWNSDPFSTSTKSLLQRTVHIVSCADVCWCRGAEGENILQIRALSKHELWSLLGYLFCWSSDHKLPFLYGPGPCLLFLYPLLIIPVSLTSLFFSNWPTFSPSQDVNLGLPVANRKSLSFREKWFSLCDPKMPADIILLVLHFFL